MKNDLQLINRLLLLVVSCTIVFSAHAQQAPIQVSGIVKTEANEPMPGVNVVLKGTAVGTTTDASGRYVLNITKDDGVLVFSFIGYLTEEVPVNARTAIDFTMTPDIKSLQEVVVTALGMSREKRQLTYSSQEVKGDELLKSKEPNFINGMTGKVSGVQITNSSGTPGASTRMVIRGATSIFGDNQPLVVVDGVPVNSAESTQGNDGGPGTSRSIDIDPSVIETVNVLKGAAATALYGSSGARGVVMITTKGGGDKKPVISLSSSLSFENAIFPQHQTKYAQGDYGVYFDGETQKIPNSYGPRMDTLYIGGKLAPKYDPYKDFFRTGLTTNNSVSVTGGGNNSSYFISYSYFKQQGTVPTADFARQSVFAKYTTKISQYLTNTFQLQYTNSDQNRTGETNYTNPLQALLTQPVSWNPNPHYNSDGSPRSYRTSRTASYWSLDNVRNHVGVNRFIPVATFNLTPFKWLTVTERLGADISVEQGKFSVPPNPGADPNGSINDQLVNNRQFNHDLIISATKEIGNLNLNVLLGNNAFSTYSQTTNIIGTGLTIGNYYNVGSAKTITANESHFLRRKVGSYAQVNLDYKRILYFSMTGRYDGSSVLAKGNTYYPYGSISAGFVFSEFLPSSISRVVSFGKLRVSRATVGNENVTPYSLNTPYEISNIGGIQFPLQGQSGFLLTQTYGNPTLKNERLNETEVGLETKLFDGRIGLETSYFYRKTIDGLMPGVQITPSTGYTGTTLNSSSMENKGLEVLLNATPIKSNKFKWDMAFTFTRIRNKVLYIAPDLDKVLVGGPNYAIVGQPYNVFYDYGFKRNQDGVLLLNNGLLQQADKPSILGNPNPDWLAGFNNTIRYGAISLSFFFDMRKGGDIMNFTEDRGLQYGTAKRTENRDPRVVQGINESDGLPNTTVVDGQSYWVSARNRESYIQDATYIKLRNITLAYDFSSTWLAKTPFKSLSLNITGRNLWIYSPYFTGGDPEVGSFGSGNGNLNVYQFSTPSSRSIGFNLKATF